EKEGNMYVSLCPELDIASQGSTVEEAKRNLEEAILLFFEHASEEEIKERLKEKEIYISPVEVKI
ncbi:type II toxin-antitoxin system HicB family antitoxin, partial [bacterium]|nr:type II toxin-antitoxin system HicB family antitoxin [bacterium]